MAIPVDAESVRDRVAADGDSIVEDAMGERGGFFPAMTADNC